MWLTGRAKQGCPPALTWVSAPGGAGPHAAGMRLHPASHALLRVVCAALALLVVACRWEVQYGSPPPAPPPDAFVSIDDEDAKVESASASLAGDVECPGCFATDWQYGSCPAIECPNESGTEMRWTNTTSGVSGPVTHGVFPACNCPFFAYNYCYSACEHAWWASVPLVFGNNDIVVRATVPGYADGSDSIVIQRVPPAPAWNTPAPGPGQVTLSWAGVASATSYNLYWSTTPYGWSSLCTKIPAVTSPYTQYGLASGVEHYYYVTALVGDAESFDSTMLAATPQ